MPNELAPDLRSQLLAATLREMRPVIRQMVAQGATAAKVQGRMAAEVARLAFDAEVSESLTYALAGATAAAFDKLDNDETS